MNKVRLLTIISIGLFLLNVGLIAFYFLGDHRPPRKQNKEIVIEKLNFDDKQIAEYEKLIQWHRTSINECEKDLRDLKMKLYSTLNSDEEINNDMIYIAIAGLQDSIEHIHYKHFQDIRKLCRPEQKLLFKEFSNELLRLFGPPPKPKHDRENRPDEGRPHRPPHDRPDREPHR